MASFSPSDDMAAFKEILRTSKNILVVAGAGLSAASGIPTFRGAGGMWRKYDAISLATPWAFENNPSTVWQFYHMRREKAANAVPNAAHLALAQFSLPSVRNAIAPEAGFTLVTQNVDGLSLRALDSITRTQPDYVHSSMSPVTLVPGAAQPAMIEMHGRLFDVICTACGHRELNKASPVCPALAGTENLMEGGATEPNILLADLPRCTKCGALARPGVVWFGERPHHMDVIDELVERADLCLVVGTSSTVQPAGSYAAEVQENGGIVAVFNLDRSEGDEDADFLFLGPCEDILPEALGIIPRL